MGGFVAVSNGETIFSVLAVSFWLRIRKRETQHRDTENTEVAQRKQAARCRPPIQILRWAANCRYRRCKDPVELGLKRVKLLLQLLVSLDRIAADFLVHVGCHAQEIVDVGL